MTQESTQSLKNHGTTPHRASLSYLLPTKETKCTPHAARLRCCQRSRRLRLSPVDDQQFLLGDDLVKVVPGISNMEPIKSNSLLKLVQRKCKAHKWTQQHAASLVPFLPVSAGAQCSEKPHYDRSLNSPNNPMMSSVTGMS